MYRLQVAVDNRTGRTEMEGTLAKKLAFQAKVKELQSRLRKLRLDRFQAEDDGRRDQWESEAAAIGKEWRLLHREHSIPCPSIPIKW